MYKNRSEYVASAAGAPGAWAEEADTALLCAALWRSSVTIRRALQASSLSSLARLPFQTVRLSRLKAPTALSIDLSLSSPKGEARHVSPMVLLIAAVSNEG